MPSEAIPARDPICGNSVAFGNSGYVIQYRVSREVVTIARIKHALERP